MKTFLGAACMLLAIAMRIEGALLDSAQSVEPQQSARSPAGWALNTFAAVMLVTSLLLFIVRLLRSLTSIGSA